MAAILNSAILNLAILDSAILIFSLKLTHTCQDWFPPFAQKNFTHSFWLNLMMAAILNSAMLDSATLPSWIQTPCYLLSEFSLKNTLTPLWCWLKLIQSDAQTHSFSLTWWWQPSWILPSWIRPSWIQPSLVFPLKLTHTCQDWFPTFAQKNFTHSFWLNLMMAAILNSAMLDSDTAILDSDTLLSSDSQTHSKALSLHSDADSN